MVHSRITSLFAYLFTAGAGLVLVDCLFFEPQWYPLTITYSLLFLAGGLVWALKATASPGAFYQLIFNIFWGLQGLRFIWSEPHWHKFLLLPVGLLVASQTMGLLFEVMGRKPWPDIMGPGKLFNSVVLALGLVGVIGFFIVEFDLNPMSPWMLVLPALGLVVIWSNLSRIVEAWCNRIQEDRRRRLVSGG